MNFLDEFGWRRHGGDGATRNRYSSSVGAVAVALAIRDAIGMGMRVFDFLRGEESYKFQFGGVTHHNQTLVIERPTLQAALRRSISSVRKQLRSLRKSA